MERVLAINSIVMNTNIRTYSKNQALVTKRRNQIARRATSLLVKQGYDRTTTRDIAEACNMTMGMLYHYVGSKEDILYLVIDDGITRVGKLADRIFSSIEKLKPEKALEKVITEYYKGADDLQDMILFVYQETKNLHSEFQKNVLGADLPIID
jgi:AcrR family transcriptional regulator